MKSAIFPDPRTATEEGLVAVGGEISPPLVLEAYSQGIFPWPQEGLPPLWFSPDPRGVLRFSKLHVPSSLKKWLRQKGPFEFTRNRAFARVIRECRKQKRPGQDGTWINSAIEKTYIELNEMGFAESFECWRDGELLGGGYGVIHGRFCSGESLFHLETNASKLALWHWCQDLQNRGFEWMDIQMLTPTSQAMGGDFWDREDFLKALGQVWHQKRSM